ncbi:hypothetical protein SAMD00019534_013880 [Acytostelium subglobosum LB1]|uniref:hypothetical protein n=1 Tax=Acytostelium subglobosum LB1 TaxID=1410327 RepID=UPI000644947C|nr:hypothetical protein SAMD00019534_013880 [Acytostelium subglobosum LB1]GAM18213.1 hypothetical protein SAMD00019534_013880 [Acytostelium subglobosum LB1]|eukprot:XP_012758809.1 hypothetical protein SAMD00019534_013880 [Acytostelium subglobosum LB1]
MSMIVRHNQHAQQVPYDDASLRRLKDHVVEINVNKLKDTKRQIESCFNIIKSIKSKFSTAADTEFDGLILSLNADRFSLFELETRIWTSDDNFKGSFNRLFRFVTCSVVYALGNIYVFGGGRNENNANPQVNTWSRCSLTERRIFSAPMKDVDCVQHLSACYDGKKYIYIVGGQNIKEKDLKGVYRFDVETEQFERYGELSSRLSNASTHIDSYSNSIIIVGGDYKHCVKTFNVLTRITDVLLMFDNIGLDSTTDCPYLTDELHNLIYFDNSFGIMFIGGQGRNYLYSIQHDQWTLIQDNDQVRDRADLGACLIRD